MTGNSKRKRRTPRGAGGANKRKMWWQSKSLPTKFDCPFCNQVESCHVKILHKDSVYSMDCVRERSKNVGRVSCDVCGECFQSTVHSLSEPLDVYNDWIDACEEANPDPDPVPVQSPSVATTPEEVDDDGDQD